MTKTITAIAYAKVTLELRVVGVRDDGYHELAAQVTSASAPADVVRVRESAITSVVVDGPCARGIPTDARNLAFAAAEALGVAAEIAIHKEIPAGAGLGGGSADAAAVLIAVRRLYGLPLNDSELADIGAGLGADVPACLRGGALRMRGIGDVIRSITLPAIGLVIATPHFGCPTPAVYRAWDDLGGPAGRRVETGVPGLEVLVNDLEPAALAVEPRLAGFREHVEDLAGHPVVLAGSGSSYVVVCATPEQAAALAPQIANGLAGEARVVAASTTRAGVAIAES